MVLEWLAEANRLQFEFAARRSEICSFECDRVDFEKRYVIWSDSKTGGIFKSMKLEFYRLAGGRGFQRTELAESKK